MLFAYYYMLSFQSIESTLNYFFVGEVLGVLCQEFGAFVYEKCSHELLRSVEANLERHIPGDNFSEGQAFTDDKIEVDVSF